MDEHAMPPRATAVLVDLGKGAIHGHPCCRHVSGGREGGADEDSCRGSSDHAAVRWKGWAQGRGAT
jgi:hypothetical protein